MLGLWAWSASKEDLKTVRIPHQNIENFNVAERHAHAVVHTLTHFPRFGIVSGVQTKANGTYVRAKNEKREVSTRGGVRPKWSKCVQNVS